MADCDDVLAITYWYLVCNNENESTKKRKNAKRNMKGDAGFMMWLRDEMNIIDYSPGPLQELRHDAERFRRYLRMSTSQFDVLLDLTDRSRDWETEYKLASFYITCRKTCHYSKVGLQHTYASTKLFYHGTVLLCTGRPWLKFSVGLSSARILAWNTISWTKCQFTQRGRTL